MKIARIIAMLLIVATCLTMIVACDNTGDNGDTPAATTTKPQGGEQAEKPGGTTTITPQKPNEPVKPNVDEQNYGVTFNFLAWKQSVDEYYDFDQLPADADDVQTELYDRNQRVNDYLGVTLKFNQISGGSGSVDEFVQAAESSIAGNNHAYDAIAAYTRCGGVLSTRGCYVNLYNVDNIDTDMPWWPAEIVSTNTVADKLYVITGDIATSLIYQMHFLIINQEYAKDLGVDVDELQQLALSGNGVKGGWTLDKLFDVTADGWKEDDTKSGKSSGDKFGLTLYAHNKYDLFYMGAGLTYVTQTDDGLETSSDYAGTKSRTILQKFKNAVETNNSYWISSSAPSGWRLADGKYLITTVEGYHLAKELRDATFTYRILPAPKYDGEQIDYYTSVGFPHSLYSIPTDAKDRAMSSAVLEVMAAESYNKVTPTLFGKVFLYKLTNAETDTAILQMIRDRTTHDLGRTFFEELGADDATVGSQVRLWRNCLADYSDKISGKRNANLDRWNTVLQKDIYDKIAALDD